MNSLKLSTARCFQFLAVAALAVLAAFFNWPSSFGISDLFSSCRMPMAWALSTGTNNSPPPPSKTTKRVIVLEFLDTDIFNLSVQNFVYFLDPLIESWDIDLVTFGMRIILAPELGRERVKEFEFVEKDPEPATDEEPGLREFLRGTSLSGEVTQEELAFLQRLRFKDKRPTALYYYRELQNLRDPLHFQARGSR